MTKEKLQEKVFKTHTRKSVELFSEISFGDQNDSIEVVCILCL